MTKRRKAIFGVSAVLVAGLLSAPFLFAHGRASRGHGAAMFAGHFGHGGVAQMGAVMRDLDLTSEQKASLHRIHDTAKDQNATARKALHEGLMEAAQVLLADPNNVVAARQAITAREASVRDLRENTLSAVSQALAVLTPEQRAKALVRLQEHHKEFNR